MRSRISYMPPVVEMPDLFSVEVRHSRHVALSLKAHFLQQLVFRVEQTPSAWLAGQTLSPSNHC